MLIDKHKLFVLLYVYTLLLGHKKITIIGTEMCLNIN